MLTPLLLGLAGSLHCVGMCGPLLLALPLDAAGRWQVLRPMLGYHAGRILTYAVLGVLFGLLGKGLAVAGFQQVLSIGAGLFMLAMALLSWRFEKMVTTLPGFGRFSRWLKSGMAGLMRGRSGWVMLGMLNGLLPCGMVYAALAGAIATTEPWEGGGFMTLFGFGTLPLLLGVSVFGKSLRTVFRGKIKILQPVLLALVGLLLLQRGFQLDLSLFDSAVPKAGMDCH